MSREKKFLSASDKEEKIVESVNKSVLFDQKLNLSDCQIVQTLSNNLYSQIHSLSHFSTL